MIFDATYSPVLGDVLFKCALEDYDTEPVHTAVIVAVSDGATHIVSVMWEGPRSQVPRWATRLLSALMPKIEEMLLTGKPQELRRWMDDQLLEQIEKERAEN